MKLVATFCSVTHCPQLFIDNDADSSRVVAIADDFGNEVRMSREQFADMKRQIAEGLEV